MTYSVIVHSGFTMRITGVKAEDVGKTVQENLHENNEIRVVAERGGVA